MRKGYSLCTHGAKTFTYETTGSKAVHGCAVVTTPDSAPRAQQCQMYSRRANRHREHHLLPDLIIYDLACVTKPRQITPEIDGWIPGISARTAWFEVSRQETSPRDERKAVRRPQPL